MRQDLLHRAHSGSNDERSLAAWVDNLLIENARLRDEARWIPVTEHPPECDVLVVLWVREIPEPLVDIAFCDDGVWFYRAGGMVETDDTTVTHWRALPLLPEVTP